MTSTSPEIYLHYLNYPDVEALAMTDAEIVGAVEQALIAQARGETTIEPRMHLTPEKDYPGHFNVLRGYIRPLGVAGVKVVGDYYRNSLLSGRFHRRINWLSLNESFLVSNALQRVDPRLISRRYLSRQDAKKSAATLASGDA